MSPREPDRWRPGRRRTQPRPRDPAGQRARRHPIVVSLGVATALAGVLLIAVGGGETEAIIGSVLIGLSAVAFVSLAFLLIGESEERDRVRHPRG